MDPTSSPPHHMGKRSANIGLFETRPLQQETITSDCSGDDDALELNKFLNGFLQSDNTCLWDPEPFPLSGSLDFHHSKLLDLSSTCTDSGRATQPCNSLSTSTSSKPHSVSGSVSQTTSQSPGAVGILKKKPRSRQARVLQSAKLCGMKSIDKENALKRLNRHHNHNKTHVEKKIRLQADRKDRLVQQGTGHLSNLRDIAKWKEESARNSERPVNTEGSEASLWPLARFPTITLFEDLGAFGNTQIAVHQLGTKRSILNNTDLNIIGRSIQDNKQNGETKCSTLMSHTQKCREKVSRQLENLVYVLPQPRPDCELKRRGQILEYTIQTLHCLIRKQSQFQAGIALSSAASLQRWVDQTITSVAAKMSLTLKNKGSRAKPTALIASKTARVSLLSILEHFLHLYCANAEWPYGELWTVDTKSQRTAFSASVINTSNADIRDQLQAFESASRKNEDLSAELEHGPLLRAVISCSEEWIDEYGLVNGQFERGDLSKSYGVKTVQIMPVTLATPRKCLAVLLFADVRRRPFSITEMETLRSHLSTLTIRHTQYVQSFEKACSPVSISMGLAGIVMPNLFSLSGLES